MILRKSFYIRWSAGRSPRVHEVNPGRDPSKEVPLGHLDRRTTMAKRLDSPPSSLNQTPQRSHPLYAKKRKDPDPWNTRSWTKKKKKKKEKNKQGCRGQNKNLTKLALMPRNTSRKDKEGERRTGPRNITERDDPKQGITKHTKKF